MDIKVLEEFAGGWREPLKKPFTYGGKTYATNGYILVRIEGELEGVSEYADFASKHIENNFEGDFDEPLPLSQFQTQEEVETCSECGGTGKVSVCPECDGEGELEFNTGYNYYTVECASCGGSGTLSDSEVGEDCEYCNGTGQVSIRTLVTIGQGKFDNRLLNKLIANLPEDTTISPSRNPLKAAVVRWNGGDGLLMPCRG